jgi:hypothetical protein
MAQHPRVRSQSGLSETTHRRKTGPIGRKNSKNEKQGFALIFIFWVVFHGFRGL